VELTSSSISEEGGDHRGNHKPFLFFSFLSQLHSHFVSRDLVLIEIALRAMDMSVLAVLECERIAQIHGENQKLEMKDVQAWL
jgi:hypothetical protein